MRTLNRVRTFGGMRRELVPDVLWKRVAPLLPRPRRRTRRGRPRCDDRAALRGILFVLKTGIAWEDLPAEVFGVSGITCWRRLDEWTRAGVFERLQQQLLDELGIRGRIDWSRAAFDSGSIRAKKGGLKRARTPPTEAKRAASITS
jgi:transposase